MKIKTIVQSFFSEDPKVKPIIVKVFDSISEFKRKLELMPSYKELKEINQTYMDERQKIINEIVEGYNELVEKQCVELNEGKKDEDKIKPGKIKQVPPDLMPEFIKRVNELLETDYKLKKKLKFSKKEIEDSKINISEMLIIEEFMLEK